jgi:peroxidase
LRLFFFNQNSLCRYWHEKAGIFTTEQMNSLQKSSLAKVLCENGDRIDRIPGNVFLNAMYPRDYVPCSHIEDIDLEPWRGCCSENMAGPNAGKITTSVFLLLLIIQ